jgi:hypothetical protein
MNVFDVVAKEVVVRYLDLFIEAGEIDSQTHSAEKWPLSRCVEHSVLQSEIS